MQWRLGSVFCLLLGVSSDYVQPTTGQVTEVTCLVIGQAQPELTPSKRQKAGPACCIRIPIYFISHTFEFQSPVAKTDRLINHDKWSRTAWRCLVSSGQTKLAIEVPRNIAIPRPSSLVSWCLVHEVICKYSIRSNMLHWVDIWIDLADNWRHDTVTSKKKICSYSETDY